MPFATVAKFAVLGEFASVGNKGVVVVGTMGGTDSGGAGCG